MGLQSGSELNPIRFSKMGGKTGTRTGNIELFGPLDNSKKGLHPCIESDCLVIRRFDRCRC